MHVPQVGSNVTRMDSNQYSAAIAAKIEKAIEASGETRHSVAQKSGVPYQTLNRRFASEGGSPFTVREVKRIADVLGISAHELTLVYVTETKVA